MKKSVRFETERLSALAGLCRHIVVNEKMETNVSNIYGAGDATNTPPFVYTAATEGSTAVNNAFSLSKQSVDYASLPWVVFTDPQIAGAGMDEYEAEKEGIPFEVSKLELSHVPRALAAQDTRGFIKLIPYKIICSSVRVKR